MPKIGVQLKTVSPFFNPESPKQKEETEASPKPIKRSPKSQPVVRMIKKAEPGSNKIYESNQAADMRRKREMKNKFKQDTLDLATQQ